MSIQGSTTDFINNWDQLFQYLPDKLADFYGHVTQALNENCPDGEHGSSFGIKKIVNNYKNTFNETVTEDDNRIENHFKAGFLYLKYYYHANNPSYKEDALNHALVLLKNVVETDDAEATSEQRAEAAYQLARIYSFHPKLRFDNPALAESYFKKAKEFGHEQATKYLRKKSRITVTAYFGMFAVYGAIIFGAALLAIGAAVAWPLTVAIVAGLTVGCVAHWFGFKYWHKIYSKLTNSNVVNGTLKNWKWVENAKENSFKKRLGLWLQNKIQHDYKAQGNPAEQLRDALMYVVGGKADPLEAKRGARFAQLPKGILSGVCFYGAMVFLFPVLLTNPLFTAGLIAATIIVGFSGGDVNRRVFTNEMFDLTKSQAAGEKEPSVIQLWKKGKKHEAIAKATNYIYGLCIGVTVLVVTLTTLFGLAGMITTVLSVPLIPVLIIMLPVFALATYASFFVAKGYFSLSYLVWLSNIKSHWRIFKIWLPMDESQTQRPSIPEMIMGVVALPLAALVSFSLTLLSVLELKSVLGWIPGADTWLLIGGPIGVAGGIPTTVLYFTSIITAFRKVGQQVNNIPSALKMENLKKIANQNLNPAELFQEIKKALTMLSNASANGGISAVPSINFLSGKVVSFIVISHFVVGPVATVVAVLAGIASLSVVSVNWNKAMDAPDKDKTLQEQAYDRHALNTFTNVALSVVSVPLLLSSLFLKTFAKIGAKLIVGVSNKILSNSLVPTTTEAGDDADTPLLSNPSTKEKVESPQVPIESVGKSSAVAIRPADADKIVQRAKVASSSGALAAKQGIFRVSAKGSNLITEPASKLDRLSIAVGFDSSL